MSGKSYTVEVTDEKEHAKAVADIFSFYFDKELIVKLPDRAKLELDSKRFELSLYKRLRMQYPQGIPRMDPPNLDFFEHKQTQSHKLLTFIYPPGSAIYTFALYFLFISIVVFAAILIFHPAYWWIGLIIILVAIIIFITIRSLEGENSEELNISPAGLIYRLKHPAGKVNVTVPLEKIRLISIVLSTGYKIEELNLFRKKRSAVSGIINDINSRELYILTDEAIFGIHTPLNEEMAAYIRYLIESAIYVMTQKKERESGHQDKK